MNKLSSAAFAALSAALLTACSTTSDAPYFEYRRTVYLDGGMGCSVELAAGNASGMPYDLIEFPGNRNFADHFEEMFISMAILFDLEDGNIPDLAFYDDWNGPNAIAMNRTLNGRYHRGTVLFGGNMLWREARFINDTDLNTVRIATILAHEFAHLAQFQRDYYVDIPTQELMADIMAGWAIGIYYNVGQDDRSLRRRYSDAAQAMFDVGDYAFNSPNHHGTPRQRKAAFELGLSLYSDANLEWVDDVFSAARRAAVDIRRGTLNRDAWDYL